MKNDYSHEKILIVISLVLFAGIIFYNAFFIPEVATPSIVYIDKDNAINDEVIDVNENSNDDTSDEDNTNENSNDKTSDEDNTNKNSNDEATIKNNVNKNSNTDVVDTSGSNNTSDENSNNNGNNLQSNTNTATKSTDSSSSEKSNSINGKVNINTATKEELAENIPGVGDSIAERIIEYRNYNGDFSSIEEIKNVSGIGDKKFESMKDAICV